MSVEISTHFSISLFPLSRMKRITQNLLLMRYCSILFICLVLFPRTCLCKNPPHICTPSCGNIRNISFPYRLKNDPQNCGHPKFELECENNVSTILYLNSQKYKVKAIHYNNYTIWLTDVSVNKNNTCSFPTVSLNDYFLREYSYRRADNTALISLMRCPYWLKNNTLTFTELPPDCAPANSSTHTYIEITGVFANMYPPDVGDNCTVELQVLTSWTFEDEENLSVLEVHNSLIYGFQLRWRVEHTCIWCNGRYECFRNNVDTVTCSHSPGAVLGAIWDSIKHPYHSYTKDGTTAAVILILLLVLVVLFAGVTLPAMIIIGLTSASAFILIELNQPRLNPYWPLQHFHFIAGLFFGVRFVTVFPLIIWFFVNKFRRRHLSRYAAIEDFLQSENNLMPIRYSYSDIKKMTKGFREKLGQGGYGTVYRGKLRSGYDVAVKLLEKPGGNGQDFMNEISTIGRIHHVNVVKLVGYCAERSKCVLVFDYMPNGSLDKYLYNREERNCLSWKRKYEIAIGVARGIEYLHKGCDIQILHFDIKPHNILLDDNFNPKITDFGLAKFFSTDKNVVTITAARGTIGYVAPELINRRFGGVSYKADVYSFGMLLIEMVGLNKDLRRNNQASSQYFPDWIYDNLEQDNDFEIDVTDENNFDDKNNTNREIFKKMMIVALWCIQMSPNDRPSMNKVVEMLEVKVERLQIPNRPTELAQVAVNDVDHRWSTYSTESTSLLSQDVTRSIEITVTKSLKQ